MFGPFFQRKLSDAQYEDLKNDLAILIWYQPKGLDVYARAREVPTALAASLLDFCLTGTAPGPLARANLSMDSVAFLRKKFIFTGWTWLKKQGAITQVARALTSLINTHELEIQHNGNWLDLGNGDEIPGYTVRVKGQPLTAA